MDRGSYEKLSIRDSARSLKKYGSTSSKHVTRNENYIKHFVSSTDTLQGVALKYNVTIEQIRRANKLWASDCLFIREFLLIPTTEIQSPTSSEQETSVVSPSAITSPPFNSSFDEDNVDEFLSKIDAAIASTKEDVKKTTINSEFASNLDSDGERRRPAISRMKQMVNNNGSHDLYHPPHTVVVQQGKKAVTSNKSLQKCDWPNKKSDIPILLWNSWKNQEKFRVKYCKF